MLLVTLFRNFSMLFERFKLRLMLARELMLEISERLSGDAKGASPNQSSCIKSMMRPSKGFGRVSQSERVVGLYLEGG